MAKMNKTSSKRFIKGIHKGAAKKTARVSKPLKRAIKAIARSEQETKYVGETIFAQQLVTAGASVPGNLNRMLAQVTQGTDEAQRLGDKIMPVRATTRWTVHFQNGVSTNFEDLQYNLIILAVKGVKNGAALATVPANSLLRNGAGGVTDPAVGVFS